MVNNIVFTPPSGESINYGRIVRQTVAITLADPKTYVDGSNLIISEYKNIEIYANRIDDDKNIYKIPFVQDNIDKSNISATFYYSVSGSVDSSYYFKASSDYFEADKTIVNTIAPEVNISSTNPSSYFYTVSSNSNPDPINSPNSSQEFSIIVKDENSNAVIGYDVYWYDSVKDGVLAYSHLFNDITDGSGNPLIYTPIQPIDTSYVKSPVDTAVYHTKTDANGESRIVVTASKRAKFGAPNVLASPKNENSLGIITIYDPDQRSIFLGKPFMIGQSYTSRGNINLDVMPDPVQVNILDYQSGSDSDSIYLLSNGAIQDFSTRKDLIGTGKSLNLPKRSLYLVGGEGSSPSPNQLFYVVVASDGTVRTSLYNEFYAEGTIKPDPNQPDPSILRYPPAPTLPYVDGLYITKDDITGGVAVNFPINLDIIKNPSTDDLISITYYLNGYVPGTMMIRERKINRGYRKIDDSELFNSCCVDYLTASELHGYSKSSTGSFLKLYVEYTIKYSKDNKIYNFFYNDHYYMSTVAPGDYG